MATCMMFRTNSHTPQTHTPQWARTTWVKARAAAIYLASVQHRPDTSSWKNQARLWRSWIHYLNKMFKYYKNSSDSLQEHLVDTQRVWSQDSGHRTWNEESWRKKYCFCLLEMNRSCCSLCKFWSGLSPGSPKRWQDSNKYFGINSEVQTDKTRSRRAHKTSEGAAKRENQSIRPE